MCSVTQPPVYVHGLSYHVKLPSYRSDNRKRSRKLGVPSWAYSSEDPRRGVLPSPKSYDAHAMCGDLVATQLDASFCQVASAKSKAEAVVGKKAGSHIS